MRPFVALLLLSVVACAQRQRPSFVVILTDDQRMDALAANGNPSIRTPNLDALAQSGVRFSQARVVLSLCSPSRAAILTGRFGSANGVQRLGQRLNDDEVTFASIMKAAGWRTGVFGKWHLKDTTLECGFDKACTFWANGRYFQRKVVEDGAESRPEGHVDAHCVDRAIAWLDERQEDGAPFVLFHNTQVPHMDHKRAWPAKAATRQQYDPGRVSLPPTWKGEMVGKPPSHATIRNRTQALKDGYADPNRIRRHTCDYYAAMTDLDAELGRLIRRVRGSALAQSTHIVYLSDNGWMLGEHGMTSKVLAYAPSLRIPFSITGPGIKSGVSDALVLNIDVAPTLLALAGLPVGKSMHGTSVTPQLEDPGRPGRSAWIYECLGGYGGNRPTLSAGTAKHKLIWTLDTTDRSKVTFTELYDLERDPHERMNRAGEEAYASEERRLAAALRRHLRRVVPR